MPPTFAAARKTYSGRISEKARFTAEGSLRSKTSRVRVMTLLQPDASRWRRIAEPTSPVWPAMYMLADLSIAHSTQMNFVTRVVKQPLLDGEIDVVVHHRVNQLLEGDGGLPPERGPRFRGIAFEIIHLRGTEIARVNFDVLLPIETRVTKRLFDEILDRVRLSGRHDVVVRLGLLKHEPHS